MFDIGIGEFGLIAVVALLVLGPERLPGAARTAGALLRKARQGWQNVRDEVERELAAEEIRKSIQRNHEQLLSGAQQVDSSLKDVVKSVTGRPDRDPGSSHTPSDPPDDERR